MSAHTAEKIISVVTVQTADSPRRVTVALAVASEALSAMTFSVRTSGRKVNKGHPSRSEVDAGRSRAHEDDAVAAVCCCRWTWCITSSEDRWFYRSPI